MQSKATPLLSSLRRFFFSFCNRFHHALNSLERYYGTTHHGSLARSTKQGRLVENTRHSHSHKPHKWRHSLPLHFTGSNEETKSTDKDQGNGLKKIHNFGNALIASTHAQSLHTMSHVLIPPTYIFIYLVSQVNGLSVENRMANSRRWGLTIYLFCWCLRCPRHRIGHSILRTDPP